MGSGTKNKGKWGVDMGDSSYNKKDWEAWRWCIKNNVAIAPQAKSNTEWYVTVKIGDGKVNVSPDTYKKTVIWEKIFEYCKYYFDKNG